MNEGPSTLKTSSRYLMEGDTNEIERRKHIEKQQKKETSRKKT